jgi:P pilus assembly chaperone PapD
MKSLNKTSKISMLTRSLITTGMLALTSLSLVTSNVAKADEVSVSKLRINLESGQTADFLTVKNESDTTKEAFEVSLKKWQQTSNTDTYDKKGEQNLPQDQLSDTQDVLASPKTLVVLPKQEKIIRIIVNDANAAQSAYSYRLVINQLPNNEVGAEKNTVKFLFKISEPVFVYKDAIKTVDKMTVDYSINKPAPGYMTFTNNDSQHIQLEYFLIGEERTPVNMYVLPKMSQVVALPKNVENALTSSDSKTQLVLVTDKGNMVIKNK